MTRFKGTTIVPWAQYGEHIPLKCTKCGATGTTKNIGCIGMRTIFVDCPCDASYLEPIEPSWAAQYEYASSCRDTFWAPIDLRIKAEVPSLSEYVTKITAMGVTANRIEKIKAIRKRADHIARKRIYAEMGLSFPKGLNVA